MVQEVVGLELVTSQPGSRTRREAIGLRRNHRPMHATHENPGPIHPGAFRGIVTVGAWRLEDTQFRCEYLVASIPR